MDRLGLSIPPFTGKPWWTNSDSKTENPVKNEEVEECDIKHQLDYEPSEELPVKRQKQNCEEGHDDNSDN